MKGIAGTWIAALGIAVLLPAQGTDGRTPDPDFETIMRGLLAFEKGRDEGWRILAELRKAGSRSPLLGRLEKSALSSLVGAPTTSWQRQERARRLLLSLRDPKRDPLLAVRQSLIPRALSELVKLEDRAIDRMRAQKAAEAAKLGKRPANVVARRIENYLTGPTGSLRKEAARRALLLAGPPHRRGVVRLAARMPKGPTRSQVLGLVRDLGLEDEAVRELAAFFESPRLLHHLRAARTLGELGSRKALPLLRRERAHLRSLIERYRKSGGTSGGPRANVSFLKSQAIISDFDVEVAQGAVIADPVVTNVVSGVVLDARVLGVTIVRHLLVLDRAVDRAIRALEKRKRD